LKIVCLSVKLFVYTTNANVYRKHPIDDVLFKAKKFVKMNLKPHYLSCFHEFFKTRILLFLGLSTQGPLNLVLHDAPRPPLFHKNNNTTPTYTQKKKPNDTIFYKKKCSTKQVQIPFSCFL